MTMKCFWLLFAVVVIAGVLAACEQAPGEVSGRVTYADGRPASVNIKLVDSSGNTVAETTSGPDGVYYTTRVVPAGTYTIKLFKGDGTPIDVEVQVTMLADGNVVQDITI